MKKDLQINGYKFNANQFYKFLCELRKKKKNKKKNKIKIIKN